MIIDRSFKLYKNWTFYLYININKDCPKEFYCSLSQRKPKVLIDISKLGEEEFIELKKALDSNSLTSFKNKYPNVIQKGLLDGNALLEKFKAKHKDYLVK